MITCQIVKIDFKSGINYAYRKHLGEFQNCLNKTLLALFFQIVKQINDAVKVHISVPPNVICLNFKVNFLYNSLKSMGWLSKLVAQWVRATVQDLFGAEHLWFKPFILGQQLMETCRERKQDIHLQKHKQILSVFRILKEVSNKQTNDDLPVTRLVLCPGQPITKQVKSASIGGLVIGNSGR